jgi:hypothetical protein
LGTGGSFCVVVGLDAVVEVFRLTVRDGLSERVICPAEAKVRELRK